MGLTLVPPAATNPPNLDELLLPDFKADLRIDGTSEDSLLLTMLAAARRHLEGREGTLGRAFLTQTWDWTLDCWPVYPSPLAVPLAPLQSVTSIKVRDSAGTVTTLDPATYYVDVTTEPGRILPTTGWWSSCCYPVATLPGLLSPITVR